MSEKLLKPKKVTLNFLAGIIEDLAIATAKGFNDMKDKFDSVDDRFDVLENRFDNLEGRFGGLERRFDILENGQEDIKLRLDGVAYRFEYTDLKKRVEKLEFKAGIS